MIPVKIQPEPPNFDAKVRQRGNRWLRQNGINANATAPASSKIPSYWTACLVDLYQAYSGTCAYLAFHFELASNPTTDHFVPKSNNAGLAYEWSNYRLACPRVNCKKRNYTGLLDPFHLLPNTFELDLLTGEIIINRKIGDSSYQKQAQRTVDQLDLNHQHYKNMRASHFTLYIEHRHADTLRHQNPFVYYEAQKQGLL